MDNNKRHFAALMLILTLFISLPFLIYHERAISKTVPFYEKLAKKHHIAYLIVGDSIGRGAGAEDDSLTWFSQWEDWMRQTYTIKLKRYSVVQSGATAYEGLYLFKKAKRPPTIDLVFLIFGENDRKYMSKSQFSYYYEALIREIKTTYPKAELITITESCLKQKQFADEIKKLSDHYHTNHIDMRPPFQHSAYSSAQLTNDSIHPNGLGYKLYTDSILAAIEKGLKINKENADLAEPITNENKLSIKETKQYKDKNELFYEANGYYYSSEKGARMTFVFNGTNLGVKVLKHEKGGEMDIYIDEQFVRRISTWWPLTKNRVLYVASGLPPGEHSVTIISTGTKSAYNQSDRHQIQLSSIVVYE